jgi:hypothetical protein
MVQDATGMWEVPPVPSSLAAGSLGPGELPQARSAPQPQGQPWVDAAGGTRTRAIEHATGHTLDGVA